MKSLPQGTGTCDSVRSNCRGRSCRATKPSAAYLLAGWLGIFVVQYLPAQPAQAPQTAQSAQPLQTAQPTQSAQPAEPAQTAATIARISRVEGTVRVVRDQRSYPGKVGDGFALESYDQVTTTAGSRVQLTTASSTGVNADLELGPDSSVYLDIVTRSSAGAGTRTADTAPAGTQTAGTGTAGAAVVGTQTAETETSGAVDLLKGSAVLTVKDTGRGIALVVRAFGVQASVTEGRLAVDTSITGDTLITADSGRVECTDDEGRMLFADARHAVEKSGTGEFRNLTITAFSEAAFRRSRETARKAAFDSGAPGIVGRYAVRYERLRKLFSAAFEKLMTDNRDILDRWIRDQTTGTVPDSAQLAADRKRILDSLKQTRNILYVFERVYVLVQEMMAYYRNGRPWTDVPGFSSTAFFHTVTEDGSVYDGRIRAVHYIMKLYSERYGEPVPIIRLGDAVLTDGTDVPEPSAADSLGR